MRFQDKVVLVTGASRNTGVGIAALFLREGARVCICGSTPDSTAQGGRLLREQKLDGFLETPADISDYAQVQAMFAKIRETCGRLDVLVNNACHQGIGPSFEEIDPEFFAAVVNTNLLGTFQVSREAVKMMLKQESRGVICIFRLKLQTFALLLGAPMIYMIGATDQITMVWVFMAAYGVFRGLFGANTHTSLFDVVAPRYRATAVGLMSMTGFLLGGTVGPYLVGALMDRYGQDRGIVLGYAVMAATYLAGSFAMFLSWQVTFKRDRIVETVSVQQTD